MEQMAFLWKHQANLCNNTFSNSESQNLIDFMESPAFLILPTGVSELNFERVPIWLIQRLLNQLSLTVLKKLTLQRCDCESSFSLMTRVSFRLALTMTQLTIEGNDRTNTFGVIGHLPLENFSSLQDLTLKRCHKIGPVLARYQKPKLESLRIPLDWDAAPLEFEELGHFLNRFQGLHSLSLETPTKFEDDLVESFLRGIEMHRDTLHPFIFRDSLLRVHDFCDSPYRQRDLDDADFRYSRISNTARKCALLSQLELPFLPTDALHEQCMVIDAQRIPSSLLCISLKLTHELGTDRRSSASRDAVHCPRNYSHSPRPRTPCRLSALDA